MVAQIGFRNDDRVLDGVARSRGEQTIETAIQRNRATIATRIAGAAAMKENKPTIRMWSRAPAVPTRLACRICQISSPMTQSSSRPVTALIRRSVTTT